MDFSKLLHGLVKIETLISLSCYLDLSKLLHVFLKVLHGFVKIFLCISRPLPNKTKLKFDPKIYWSFCFKIKVLNKSKYSMPWGRCSFGKVFFSVLQFFPIHSGQNMCLCISLPDCILTLHLCLWCIYNVCIRISSPLQADVVGISGGPDERPIYTLIKYELKFDIAFAPIIWTKAAVVNSQGK